MSVRNWIVADVIAKWVRTVLFFGLAYGILFARDQYEYYFPLIIKGAMELVSVYVFVYFLLLFLVATIVYEVAKAYHIFANRRER